MINGNSFLHLFSSFLLKKLVDFIAFLCPDLSSTGKYFIDMKSTSSTCVNNSKICDLYAAIWILCKHV